MKREKKKFLHPSSATWQDLIVHGCVFGMSNRLFAHRCEAFSLPFHPATHFSSLPADELDSWEELSSSDHGRIRRTFGSFRRINKHFLPGHLGPVLGCSLNSQAGPESIWRTFPLQSKQPRPAARAETVLSGDTIKFSGGCEEWGTGGSQYGGKGFVHFGSNVPAKNLRCSLFRPSEERRYLCREHM